MGISEKRLRELEDYYDDDSPVSPDIREDVEYLITEIRRLNKDNSKLKVSLNRFRSFWVCSRCDNGYNCKRKEYMNNNGKCEQYKTRE